MIHVSNHPLILDKLARIRDVNTKTEDFRRIISEIAMLLTYEVTRDFPVKDVRVKTPLAVAHCKQLSKEVVLVAILRAGLGLVDGVLKVIPSARQAHVGIYRDEETLKPIKYYLRFPDNLKDKIIIVLDPMLATGGSAVEAINIVKTRGAKDIYFMSIISSRYGLETLKKYHPDVKIFTASVDEKLNDNGYIVPGLGDAGDRMFGTQ